MCLSPVLVSRNVAGIKRYEFVPCGHCVECMKAKQTEFATRVMEEAKSCSDMYFITLTYNDENVPWQENEIEKDYNPETGEVTIEKSRLKSLNNHDITAWKKRVRIQYKRAGHELPDFKYAICGEYGPRTQRPHYHGIVFCSDKRFMAALEDDWKSNYGYTCFKKINTLPHDGKDEVIATAKYVAKYVCKIKSLEYDKVRTKEVASPRKITSRGFGLSKRFEAMRRHCLALDQYNYDPDTLMNLDTKQRLTKGEVADIINIIKRRRKYEYNGKSYPLSRYAREKMFYKKDSRGRLKSTTIQDMVSFSLQFDANKDYHEQLRQIASRKGYKMDYQACKELQDILDLSAKEREEAILQTNIQAFQQSIY